MSKVVDARELYGQLSELIREGKSVSVKITGNSMAPFMYHMRDTIFIKAFEDEPKVGQICLYQRDNGQYVVHRVIKCEKDKTYTIIGDGQTEKEKGIRRDQMIGYVYQIKRKNKMERSGTFWWFFFEKIWLHMIPLRRIIMKLYQLMSNILFK